MGIPVLVIGESGTGKSSSLRNFTKNQLSVVRVIDKPLPFKTTEQTKFKSVVSDSYRVVRNSIVDFGTPSIVIDDGQYLMANEFMRRSSEKGYDKFTEIAKNFWELIQSIKELPADTIVYLLCHSEVDQNGNEKIKTIGKLLDEKITVEGMFTIVLKTVVKDGKYYFQTQNSGHDTVKSPMGMFSANLIDNDLKIVDSAVRDYWDLSSIPLGITASEPGYTKEETVTPTVAEKIASEGRPTDEMPRRKRREETVTPTEVKDDPLPQSIETADNPPRRRVRKVIEE